MISKNPTILALLAAFSEDFPLYFTVSFSDIAFLDLRQSVKRFDFVLKLHDCWRLR